MRKFLTVVSFITVMATPAFAQSNAGGYGTGNVMPFTFDSNGSAHPAAAANERQPSGANPLYNSAAPKRQGHRNPASSAGEAAPQ
jgi:hypothetical protein